MKLSLCITTYNRYEMTIESFSKVLDDPRIDDIVIMDDCSTEEVKNKLLNWFGFDQKKEHVKIFFQDKNVGMSLNKRDAIGHAKNEWAIIFDSDNIIGPDYLDAFYNHTLADTRNNFTEHFYNCIFCPDFAKPNFDYRAFSRAQPPTYGIYNAKDAARCMIDSRFNCLMNTCNYIVNRDFYLQAYKHNPQHKASDTIWHNYNHLKAGGLFAVVPDMQYEHRVHEGSGFMQEAQYNMQKSEEVRKLIQQL
jgi:glycosyltransferase involved in cell wall biosynthesis